MVSSEEILSEFFKVYYLYNVYIKDKTDKTAP